MNNQPTPETDAKKWIEVGYNSYVVSATFARQLERERDEARRECKFLWGERDEARELLASEKITRNHIIKRSVEVERERDEAITRRMETIMQCELYEQERDEAREALKELWQISETLLPELNQEQLDKWHKAIFTK